MECAWPKLQACSFAFIPENLVLKRWLDQQLDQLYIPWNKMYFTLIMLFSNVHPILSYSTPICSWSFETSFVCSISWLIIAGTSYCLSIYKKVKSVLVQILSPDVRILTALHIEPQLIMWSCLQAIPMRPVSSHPFQVAAPRWSEAAVCWAVKWSCSRKY